MGLKRDGSIYLTISSIVAISLVENRIVFFSFSIDDKLRRADMSYSIFSDTMADMTYQQIEKAVEQKWPVLFPIAVIEEHGPHLSLGTDTYLTYNLCKIVKEGLRELGLDALIAPPYYWGINVATNGFAGSFTVKPETMVLVLCDLLECLRSWGFENIFLLNVHGDFRHTLSIINAAKKAYEEYGTGIYFIVSDFFIKRAGLSGEEPYIIVQPTKPEPPPEYLDIHAGGFETSLMIKDFPELVNIDLARHLKSSLTTLDGLKIWQQGGEKAKEVTPLGYCGNPSQIDLEKAGAFEKRTFKEIPRMIVDVLNRK
jgi:creatinine amidohydrolase